MKNLIKIKHWETKRMERSLELEN